MVSSAAFFQTLQTIDHTGISTSYAAIGTPFANAIRAFRVINATDGDMYISLGATNPILFVPAASFVLYDVTANCGLQSTLWLPGVQFYVKYSTSPSKNIVAVEALSGKGD